MDRKQRNKKVAQDVVEDLTDSARLDREKGVEPKTRATRKALPKCGAKSKTSGETCQNGAGKGTDHPGYGRCKFHGGAKEQVPPESRYAAVKAGPRLKELIQSFSEDEDMLKLEGELVLLRALAANFVERYDEFAKALLGWHAAFQVDYLESVKAWSKQMNEWHADGEDGDPPLPPHPEFYEKKPRQILDITDAGKLVDRIAHVSELIYKRQKTGMLTLATMDQLLERLGLELVETLREVRIDEATRTQILTRFEQRWDSVDLDNPGQSAPPIDQAGTDPDRAIN